ncbi:MAG: c-type cytochrome [Anaerolineae bacterium]
MDRSAAASGQDQQQRPRRFPDPSNMPAFESALSDAEIRAVLEYLKSTWPEQVRQTQWLVSQNDPLPPAQ